MMASTLVSGFAALAGAIRSLTHAVHDHRSHVYPSHNHDSESNPSTHPSDEYNACEMGPEARSAGMPVVPMAEVLDDDLKGDTPDPSSPQHPQPRTREKRGHKLWKKVQRVVSNSNWPTHILNAAQVAMTSVLNVPPSLEYTLPAPVTDPRTYE